jgi:hypothetical protein
MRPYRGALRVCWATVVALLSIAVTARAATIDVTTPLDPASPICPSATCSLRGALLAAAAGDTISLPAGEYKRAEGELTMPRAVTIVGAGASSTTIDGQGTTRVLDITTTSSDQIGLTGVTITGGAFTGPGTNEGGGGIYVSDKYTGPEVTLTGVAVTGNHATVTSLSNNGGGGIYNDSGATVALIDSTVSSNTATLTGGTSNDGGGGIYNDDGDFLLMGSHVDDNTVVQGPESASSNDGGGGIYNNGENITLTDSTVDGNSDTLGGGTSNDGGGAIYNNGEDITLTDSQAGGNHLTMPALMGPANGGGGVYDNGHEIAFVGSSVDGNTSSITGSEDLGGVGLFLNGNSMTATGSTIADNTGTVSGTGSEGGAIFSEDGGQDTYVNDTISGNSVTVTSIGSNNGGGAIYAGGDGATISDTTIAGNTVNEQGGGIFVTGGPYTLKNTILAGNAATPAGNCATGGGLFLSDGFNLDSGDTCHLTQASDHTNANAALGPLADNGGSTLTEALGPGSAAVNTGSCTDASGNPVTTDERGDPRPAPGVPAGECDIGAFEAQPIANTSPPAVSGNATSGDTLTCSDGTWTNGPSAFTFQWTRDGKPIPGATRDTYVVQFADQAQTLACSVTASNGYGPATAGSAGVFVGDLHELKCPKPSGRVSGVKLGPLSLGETLKAAEKALKMHSPGPYGFTEFCLYAGFGIRAATPSTKLLHKLPRKRRAAVTGRLVIALTPNRYYALDGILPGSEIRAVPKKLHLEKPFVIGKNTWYLVPGKSAIGLLKVRQGEIFEIGLANKRLIGGSRKSQKFFLQSFGAGSSST